MLTTFGTLLLNNTAHFLHNIAYFLNKLRTSCVVDVFRSGHQYLRSAHWSFILEGYSVKWEVCIDLSEVRADWYQRSVDFRELHTDIWEVVTDIQEGRSDV